MATPSLDEWVASWRAKASRSGVLGRDEWEAVEEAINDSYLLAELRPPHAIIRARSPREVMAMVRDHQAMQPFTQVNAAARIAATIAGGEMFQLERLPFRGMIAARVDIAGLRPSVWGTDLHPHMVRPPCAGHMRIGLAAEAAWILNGGSVRQNQVRSLTAIIGRSLAGPGRFLDDLVFVSNRPVRFRTDDEGLPHCGTGPAIEWTDGTVLNFWHGTRVPKDFFTWNTRRALAEVNVEVRRCAFERIGVDVLEQSLRLLAEAPDPANPPHLLRLYDLPRPWLSGRLLVVENASIDKGGHRRRFQIFVPPHITDAVEAAANSFGMTADQYRQLQRAT
jgi:hypothetical protein